MRKFPEATAQPRHGVAFGGIGVGDVRRGRNPIQPGVAPEHGAFPAAHFYDIEFGAGTRCGRKFEPVFVERGACKFADSQSVNVRHGIHTDVALPFFVEHRTVGFQPAERIRAVEHEHGNSRFETRFHDQPHTTDKSVAARADILQVDDHFRDAAQHFRRRFTRPAVKRENRQFRAEARIFLVGDNFFCGNVAVNAVFGTEKSDEIHSRTTPARVKDANRAFTETVYACLVRYQTDAFSAQTRKFFRFQHIDAEADATRRGNELFCRRSRVGKQIRKQESARRQKRRFQKIASIHHRRRG